LKTKDVQHRPHKYRVNQCAPDGYAVPVSDKIPAVLLIQSSPVKVLSVIEERNVSTHLSRRHFVTVHLFLIMTVEACSDDFNRKTAQPNLSKYIASAVNQNHIFSSDTKLLISE
jgi:hypothetical protein